MCVNYRQERNYNYGNRPSSTPPTLLLRRPVEGRWSQAPTQKGTKLIVLPDLVHFTCGSETLSLPSKSTLSCLFLVSPFVRVNDMLSYLFSACANLRAPSLLFILPVTFWPKISVLVTSAQISFQRGFLWNSVWFP